MNKKIITVLVIAVAITGIAYGLSVPVPAEAAECGLSAQGEVRSLAAQEGRGKQLGQETAESGQAGGLGQQETADNADHCRQNP